MWVVAGASVKFSTYAIHVLPCLLLLLLIQPGASQSPDQFNNTARGVPVPTWEEVMDHINPGQPPVDKALYWTGLNEKETSTQDQIDAVKAWGRKFGLVTYSDDQVWQTPGYINLDQYDGTKSAKGDFAIALFTTFAARSRGKVYLVMPDGMAPWSGSRWWKYEFNGIKTLGTVTEVYWIDGNLLNTPGGLPDLSQVTKLWWKQGDANPATYPGQAPQAVPSSTSKKARTKTRTGLAGGWLNKGTKGP